MQNNGTPAPQFICELQVPLPDTATPEQIHQYENALLKSAIQAKDAVEAEVKPAPKPACSVQPRLAKRRHLQTAVKSCPAKAIKPVNTAEFKQLKRLRAQTQSRWNLVSARLQYSTAVQSAMAAENIAWEDLKDYLEGLQSTSVEDLREKRIRLELKLEELDDEIEHCVKQ